MLPYSEVFLVIVSLLILSGYHLWLFFQVRREPLSTSIGFNNHVRETWIKYIQDDSRDILVVQTLRNWTMAATFLGSTSIILSLGILSFALTTDGLSDIAHEFNFLGSQNHRVLLIKTLLLTAVYIFVFLTFILAVRFYNHAAFLINIPKNYHLSINSESALTALNQGALYYYLGMRGYYVSIPLVFWLMGPVWMFFSAIIVTFLVYKLDHGI